MIDPLQASIKIAGAGLEAQSTRLRIISENVANAQSTANTPGGDPYSRKTVSFDNVMDRTAGLSLVRGRHRTRRHPVRRRAGSRQPGRRRKGFRQDAQRQYPRRARRHARGQSTYEANLQVAKQSSDLMSQTVALLKDV